MTFTRTVTQLATLSLTLIALSTTTSAASEASDRVKALTDDQVFAAIVGVIRARGEGCTVELTRETSEPFKDDMYQAVYDAAEVPQDALDRAGAYFEGIAGRRVDDVSEARVASGELTMEMKDGRMHVTAVNCQ